jgi:beta-phosphoglucomutase-like phosphatase (HAD superfamily)
MKAVIFGGLGTIANTSYLQRKAFNSAFEQLSIEWHWGEEEYRGLLIQAGGGSRITDYNNKHGGLPKSVTPDQVHKIKTSLFHRFMTDTKLPLREGVQWVIDSAKFNKLKLVFATTTSQGNIDILLSSAGLNPSTFDIISNCDLVNEPKPEPDVYQYCLEKLNILAVDTIAIEDARTGVVSAVSAGISCVAFPNEFTAEHSYVEAVEKVGDLEKSTHLNAFFASDY